MDEIQFKLGEYIDDQFVILYADVYINELRLIDLICQVEDKHYGWQRSPASCGYVGLHVLNMPFFNDAFPGILSDAVGSSEFWGTVLTCTCGIDLCSSILARVEILGDFVMWHEVLNPWLGPFSEKLKAGVKLENDVPCDYSSIGPFVFRRRQYVGAWYAFKGWVMDWKRWNLFNAYTRRIFP